MNSIHNIIVTGNWGAGKTTSCRLLLGLLSQEGIGGTYYSDRLAFEDEVRKDIAENGQQGGNGILIGKHSVLVADGEPGHMSFRLLDGVLGNIAHRRMIVELANTKPGIITVVEYAIGPDTKLQEDQEGELLDQSSHFLVEQLIRTGAAEHTLAMELRRPFALRRASNLTREDPTDQTAFDHYGREGGLMTPEDAARLGENFLSLNNVGCPLEELVSTAYQDFIRPRLAIATSPEGNFISMEGNLARPEARF